LLLISQFEVISGRDSKSELEILSVYGFSVDCELLRLFNSKSLLLSNLASIDELEFSILTDRFTFDEFLDFFILSK